VLMTRKFNSRSPKRSFTPDHSASASPSTGRRGLPSGVAGAQPLLGGSGGSSRSPSSSGSARSDNKIVVTPATHHILRGPSRFASVHQRNLYIASRPLILLFDLAGVALYQVFALLRTLLLFIWNPVSSYWRNRKRDKLCRGQQQQEFNDQLTSVLFPPSSSSLLSSPTTSVLISSSSTSTASTFTTSTLAGLSPKVSNNDYVNRITLTRLSQHFSASSGLSGGDGEVACFETPNSFLFNDIITASSSETNQQGITMNASPGGVGPYGMKGGPGLTDPLLARQKHHHRKAFEFISKALRIDEESTGLYLLLMCKNEFR